MAVCFKAYAIHNTVYFRYANDSGDRIFKRCFLAKVDDLTTKAFCLLKSFWYHVSYNHYCGAQQMARCCTGKSYWSRTCNIHYRSGSYSCCNGTMKTSWENV